MKNKYILLSLLGSLTLAGCNFGNTPSSNPSHNSSTSVSTNSSSSNSLINSSVLSSTSTTVSSGTSTVTSSSTTSNSSSSSSSTAAALDLEATLASLKEGVKVSSVVNETYKGAVNVYHLQNTSKEKEFSYIYYKDESRTDKHQHEYYTSGSGDYIYATRLDVSNQYNYYKVYNPSTSEYYTWNDGYNNAFLSLTSESFNKVNDNEYELKESEYASVQDELSALLYSNPGLTLTGLTLTKDGNNLYLNGDFTYLLYTINVSALVLESGENTAMDYRCLPFEETNDDTFTNMLNKLQANNYTAVVENYEDDILDSTSLWRSESDKIYYESAGYYYGYYEVEEGYVQEVEYDGLDFYKVGSPLEGSLDEVRPAFALSSVCFDKEDGVYSLKDGVEGYSSAFTLLEAYAEELADFTIEVLDNGESYRFVNVYGDYKTVVTFSNFGSTSTGFTSDSVLEAIPGTTWAEYVDDETFEYLVGIAGDEAYNLLAPEGYTEWYQLSEDTEYYLLFAAEADENILDYTYAYIYALMDEGYSLYEEDFGLFGGYMMLKEVEINGEENILIVELVPTEEAFYVAIYDVYFYEANLEEA